MNWKIIFNPLGVFEERKLVIFGLFVSLVGVLMSDYFRSILDGALDVHAFSEITLEIAFKANLVSIFSLWLALFGMGKIINTKTRWLDILNTVLVARIPLYLLTIFTNTETMNQINEKIIEEIDNTKNLVFTTQEMTIIIIFTVISLLGLAYYITLLVFGFKTATHSKKWFHFVGFGLAILLAEILSKYLLDWVL